MPRRKLAKAQDPVPTRQPLILCGFVFALVAAAILVWPGDGILLRLTEAQGIDAPALPDGTLARTADDPRVYFIENGLRRWVDSEKSFHAHGFRPADVRIVPASQLSRMPEGERVTDATRLVLPEEAALLPDLAPFPAQDMRLANMEGRTVLRFTTAFWNLGSSPFVLSADANGVEPGDEVLETLQNILSPDGSARHRLVGNFLWHAPHHHYHFEQFANYRLELVKPADGVSSVPGVIVTQKTTFCMRDDRLIDAGLPGAPRAKVYSVCGKYRQGVSVGWADVYPYTLPDQYIDVHDFPAGIYRLSFDVDPIGRFVEKRYDNNLSAVLFNLDPAARTMKVIAAAAAFSTPQNTYPEGMLVRRDGESGVYVIRHGKKRLLRSEEIFRSYGYRWEDVFVLPPGVVDAIPSDSFVRLAGTSAIYRVNDLGYRRQILNPEVLRSYGFEGADVADVNATEFAAYPGTDLIMRAGESRVFSIRAKKFVAEFDELALIGMPPQSVQVVNETDFESYAVEIVAKGLDVPWDIAFEPDGTLLVTERPGVLRRLGAHPATVSIPGVSEIGEGGLMGIALHPDFARNRLLYLYFTAEDGGKKNRIVRYRFENDVLTQDKVILDNVPSAIYHDGGRIRFGPDGMLYVTTGDANSPATAQNLASLAGKTLRLTPDGGIPSDNPFGSAVWSYGHRNSQGMAWDSKGRLWETEHGRSGALTGFDELNRIDKAANFGWPTIQGGETRQGMVTPAINSGANTTWAPSGLAYANGKLFFAGLKGASLYQATVTDDGRATDFKSLLQGTYGRLRAVVVGPDGLLYVTTSNRDGRGTPKDGDDKILRINPEFFR